MIVDIDQTAANADWLRTLAGRHASIMWLRDFGGAGSGNFGHAGRPGEVGGSAPGETSGATPSGEYTAASVAKALHLDPEEVAKTDAKILANATTDAERQYHEEMAVAETAANRTLKNGDTRDKFAPGGRYTEERLKMHEEIMMQFLEDHVKKYGRLPSTDNVTPIVTWMAGMPGAGKSSAAKDLEGNPDLIAIDPDRLKAYLPEYRDGLGAAEVARESGEITDKLMVFAASQRMNIRVDGTMKTSGSIPASFGDAAIGRMAAFKDAGYRVEVRFVDVDVNQSLQNTMTRFHEQFVKTGTGRYVAPEFSRGLKDPQHGTKPRASFEMAKNTDYKGKPLVDAWTHSTGWNGDPKTSHQPVGSFGTLTPGGVGQ